jgi:hypothetical protein
MAPDLAIPNHARMLPLKGGDHLVQRAFGNGFLAPETPGDFRHG